MGKYGSGITFAKACLYEKEEIKHALNHEIITGYDENGEPVYSKTTKEKADKVVLDMYDALVFQALDSLATGRTLERMYQDKVGSVPALSEYISIKEEESRKYNDYKYEDPELNIPRGWDVVTNEENK